MRLFTLENDAQVELNKEWIMLIPEFADLLKRDKGSPGDYRGDKKLKAKRELTFIYFDLDFTSPIREWPEFERRQEAMRYAGLEEKDLDDKVMAAHAKYDELLLGSSRSLKTLRAVEKSLDALDTYFENLDFSATDKKGELVHNPNSYLLNLERLGKAYDSLDKFRKRVQEELKGEASIRGTATMGRKESGGMGEWKEALPDNIPPVAPAGGSFADIGRLLKEAEAAENEED